MFLMLQRFNPQEWPYRSYEELPPIDYKISGGDSEGGYFFRNGKVTPINSDGARMTPEAALKSEQAFLHWILQKNSSHQRKHND